MHTLTHELKSPLAAIRGAAELLQDDMPEVQRQRFASNIQNESQRMQQLIERLLNLAMVEQRQELEERVAVPLAALVDELLSARSLALERLNLSVEQRIDPALSLHGERFLLQQALANLLDNALDFTPLGGTLRLAAERMGEAIHLTLFNSAAAIPDYALSRLCERFYSLPRPHTGRKSTGLGLNFVAEVVQLHGGELKIENVEGGVLVSLWLP